MKLLIYQEEVGASGGAFVKPRFVRHSKVEDCRLYGSVSTLEHGVTLLEEAWQQKMDEYE